MSKVFEALRRQQQSEQSGDVARDPLAAETGTPDTLRENGDNGEAHVELPAVIGAPVGPRSNEGALFHNTSLGQYGERERPELPVRRPLRETQVAHAPRTPAEQLPESQTAPPANGRTAVEYKRPAPVNAHSVAEKPKQAPPVIRRIHPEALAEATPMPVGSPVETSQQNLNRQRRYEVPVQPILQSRLHPRLILLTEPQAPECEQYRTLRTQLFHAAEKKKTQVVTVTSTLAGEGKTSTVINLGLAIAQSKEKRVLIIDGDLRRPNVATYLGVKAKTGLGEALSGDVRALDSLFTLEGHELYILAVSREAANPTELLSSERLAEMIAELREYFDFILVDSPPVLPFADARLLANHADAVVLVIRSGMAQYETVEKAIDMLPAGKLLGVVLNGAQHSEEAGYYDYYYHYAQRDGRRPTLLGRLLGPLRSTNLGRKWNRK